MEVLFDEPVLTVKTVSAAETEELGRILGKFLPSGTVVALIGDLGTGKTCFTRGIAAGAGVASTVPVVSPSFTILNEYPGRVPIYHFDFYRLDTPGDDFDWEWREYLHGQGISVIEWAEKVANFLPEEYITVHFLFCGEEARTICMEGRGEGSLRIIRTCAHEIALSTIDSNPKMSK